MFFRDCAIIGGKKGCTKPPIEAGSRARNVSPLRMPTPSREATTAKTIAHLSDLHIGRSPQHFVAAAALRDAVLGRGVDCVVVTGDVTQSGKRAEYAQFETLFGELRAAGKLVVVPGNHDRRGHEVSKQMMDERVDVVRGDGICLVRIDTTGPHNKFVLTDYGFIDKRVLAAVDRALDAAAPGDVVVTLLHHHPLPLPGEGIIEKLCMLAGLPHAGELWSGRKLLHILRGRCDLVLHGHRHVPCESILPDDERGLKIYNAGSSTLLGRFRLFRHEAGRLLGDPVWIDADPRLLPRPDLKY